MKRLKTLVLSAVCLLWCASASAGDDLELLRLRFKSEYLDCPAGDYDASYVRGIMDSMSPDGSWPDINYADVSNTGFQHTVHLGRMSSMALALVKDESSMRHDAELRGRLDAAMDFWLVHDFQSDNWWWNQIGVPRIFISYLYILDEEICPAHRDKMLEIASRANLEASGARPGGDRMFIASMYTKTMVWARNELEVGKILNMMDTEFCFGDEGVTNLLPSYFKAGKGLERDMCFHHRPDRVDNTTTYGLTFALSYLEWALIVKDTGYRFGDRSVHLLIDYFLDGVCKHRVYACQNDPGAENRENARIGGRSLSSDASLPCRIIDLCGDYRRDELEAVVRLCRGDRNDVPSYARFFWNTEYFSLQRPRFFTSVRMFSSRNANMEYPHNHEGILNHFRGDGANYISPVGDEYLDISPVFDFRKVPGTTVMQADSMPPEDQLQKWGTTDFVGAVTDGCRGAVADDFVGCFDPVKARKSWFFFDDMYVCLGSEISCEGDGELVTTLNQCYLRGDVIASGKRGHAEPVARGEHSMKGTGWVHHDGVGYVFLDRDADIRLSGREVEGNWRRVSLQGSIPDRPVYEDVFALWLSHGYRPAHAGYAYAVLPGMDVAATEKFSRHSRVRVVSNTGAVQAVEDDSVSYAVLYEGGSVRFSRRLSVSCETPCIIMAVRDARGLESVYVSDPTRTQTLLSVRINGKSYGVELPSGAYAGSSVKLPLAPAL